MRKILEYLFLWSPASPLLKKAFGETTYQKLSMCLRIGYWPDINNPRSFNEKVMHRKLFTNNSLFSTVSDKYTVREYVRNKYGKQILTRVHQSVRDPGAISFNDLPNEFVIKPTHGSGWVYIVEDKSKESFEEIKSKCQNWLSQSYGETKGEYWYSNIEPRIIIEERLKDSDGSTPPDYKYFVFHGEVRYIQVDYDRFSDHSRRFYDRNWNPQDFELKFPLGPKTDEPEQLDKMIEIAETLGDDFDFVRVDLYEIDGNKVVFGEITLAPGSGGEKFNPREYDFEFGSYW